MFSPTRLVPLLSATALFLATSALADTFILKGGEKLEGKVVKEDDREIVVEYRASAAIKDTRIILKADLEKIEKENPEEVAYAPLKSLKPGENSKTEADYDDVIHGLQAFVNQFPQGSHAGEGKSQLAAFAAEQKRVEGGEIKLAGRWISQEDAQKEKYQLNAQATFGQMQEQARRSDLMGALNTFDSLEKSYPGARIYPDAVALARQVLQQVKPTADRALQTWQMQKKERDEGNKLVAEPKRSELIALQTKEQQQLDAAFEAATKANLKWPPLQARNEKSLAALAAKVPPEQKRLEALPIEKMRRSIQLAEKGRTEFGNGNLDSADDLFKQALTSWGPNEVAARWQKELPAARAATLAARATPVPVVVVATPVATPVSTPMPTPTPTPTPVPVAPPAAVVEEEPGFFSGVRGLLAALVILGGLGYGYFIYKKKKQSADEEFE